MMDVGLSRLSSSCDVVLSDIWGVVHNGVSVFTAAVDALIEFRRGGGTVILVSNASRRGDTVRSDLAKLNMPATAYDGIVTSGDIARELIASNPGCAIFDVGPADATNLLTGLDVILSSLEAADVALTSGAFEAKDRQPEDMRSLLIDIADRDLPLICANPDLVTSIGGQTIKCSGSLAALYAELGGKVVRTGKPEAPIYQRALALAGEFRTTAIRRERVLVIGDSIATDIAGAAAAGFASLFVAGGIHAQALNGPKSILPAEISRLFNGLGFAPTHISLNLCW